MTFPLSLFSPTSHAIPLLLLALCAPPLAFAAQSFPWQTNPPIGPDNPGPIVYPEGAVPYERSAKDPPAPPFLVRNWYIGFILMALVVVAVYVMLFVCVRKHFRVAEQRESERELKRMNSLGMRNPLENSDNYSEEERD
ncbi:hypothetical protein LSM04_005186 [Trypanosoma melophagium]|uniref:uncharacterized protein n=1 Tax=Trypanosoma melophagium TaxID=715481 RepID=UPI00351A5B5F|nr:hypothetical protein LSM04_005186 [Trypanosoma melophagium]